MSLSRPLAFLLSLLLAASAWAGSPSFDVVFDIDWTLFYPSKSRQEKDSFQFNNEYFRMVDGAPEVIAKLHSEGHRISIFSGGTADRNQAAADFLIKKLQTLGVQGFSFYKVLSFEHLSPRTDAPRGAKFSERHIKDLKPFFSDLSKTVLVDDLAGFAAAGQEKNLYALGKTYTFHEAFNAEAKGPYDPPSLLEWAQERRKIINFFELFHAATREAAGDDALRTLQALRVGASLCSKAFISSGKGL